MKAKPLKQTWRKWVACYYSNWITFSKGGISFDRDVLIACGLNEHEK